MLSRFDVVCRMLCRLVVVLTVTSLFIVVSVRILLDRNDDAVTYNALPTDNFIVRGARSTPDGGTMSIEIEDVGINYNIGIYKSKNNNKFSCYISMENKIIYESSSNTNNDFLIILEGWIRKNISDELFGILMKDNIPVNLPTNVNTVFSLYYR